MREDRPNPRRDGEHEGPPASVPSIPAPGDGQDARMRRHFKYMRTGITLARSNQIRPFTDLLPVAGGAGRGKTSSLDGPRAAAGGTAITQKGG